MWLSSDQIKEAVKAIEKGEAKTREAKREMVKANLRLSSPLPEDTSIGGLSFWI